MRRKIVGTGTRPRIVVSRSNRYLSGQIVDDSKGITLMGVHEKTWMNETKDESKRLPVEKAKEIGLFLGKKAHGKKITTVVFDRNGYKYHGRVKAFAEGLRESGLTF